ncbi:dTMP kinase [Hydrogenimonas sp.]
MYVAFEGIDTAGKSTQIALAKDAFSDAVVTKEPGGTELGMKIRALLLESGCVTPRSETLLFLADRAEHIEKVIRPNLHRIILSDRSFISGIAYAHIHEKLPIDILLQLNRFATDGIFPDRIVLLRMDEKVLRTRLERKRRDAIESRGIEYMMAVQKCMLELLDLLQIDHIAIDAAQPAEKIAEAIKNYLRQPFEKGYKKP